MLMKTITTVTTIAMIVGTTLGVGSIADAAENDLQTTASVADLQTYSTVTATNSYDHSVACSAPEKDAYQNAVDLIDPYIEIEGDHLVANVPDAVKNSISSDLYESLMASLSYTNTLISEGELNAEVVDPRYGEDRDAGVNGVSVHWWGVSLKMSNDVFNRVSDVVAAGGAALFVAGTFLDASGIGLPAGISLQTLGGVIMAGVLIMKPCNWNGRGVGFHYAWRGPAWCWPQ